MVEEGKAALAALLGYVVICVEAAMILNAVAAHFAGTDVLAAFLFGQDADIVLAFPVATAILAVPIFLVFRGVFRVFQLTHWMAFAFGGAVAALTAMLFLGGQKEALAFALAGAVAGNLYREAEVWAIARGRMAEPA
jgi:hypothetical protein